MHSSPLTVKLTPKESTSPNQNRFSLRLKRFFYSIAGLTRMDISFYRPRVSLSPLSHFW